MIIHISNIGAIRQALFKFSKLTIICGDNNTGKTYATYAFHGFLTYFHEIFFIKLERDIIEDLFNNGILNISYKEISEKRQKFLDEACKEYVQQLHLVFASEKNNFSNSDFKITPAAFTRPGN